MYTPRENFLRTLKGENPDRLVNEWEPFALIMNDPVMKFARGNRKKGSTTLDKWGTTICWPADQHGAMPHVTEETKVLKDITRWRDYVNVPDLVANATDWTDALATVATVDRNEKLIMGFMGTGIFEQAHFLMGFEDTLCNLLMEPEAMHELLEVIFEYRLTYAKLLVENLKPDIILSHDDWGEKTKLLMSAELWREFFKPLYAKLYGYMKENGVIVMHHADSHLEAIVEDMVDIGVDVWQGALPQNNLPKIQKQLNGRMVLMGGIDAAITDVSNWSEDVIRAEVRRACDEYAPGGGFIPCVTYGAPGTIYGEVDGIVKDEISKCSPKYFPY